MNICSKSPPLKAFYDQQLFVIAVYKYKALLKQATGEWLSNKIKLRLRYYLDLLFIKFLARDIDFEDHLVVDKQSSAKETIDPVKIGIGTLVYEDNLSNYKQISAKDNIFRITRPVVGRSQVSTCPTFINV